MIVKELYEYAKEHNAEDYDITTSHETGEGSTCVNDVCEIDDRLREIEIY